MGKNRAMVYVEECMKKVCFLHYNLLTKEGSCLKYCGVAKVRKVS